MKNRIWLALILLLTVLPPAGLQAAQQAEGQARSHQIVSVDAVKNVVTVKGEDEKDQTLTLNQAVKITKDGRDITLAEIKAGERIFYLMDGPQDNQTVKSITVLVAKTAKR